jgi:predicted DNA binding CopG/RHH family protein
MPKHNDKARERISIRHALEDVTKVEALAEAKGLRHTALLRMWIKERLAA